MPATSDVIGPCSPFFIVRDIRASLEFYTGRLGFEVRHVMPEDEPFFAIVGREAAQLLLKSVDGVEPQPNPEQHEWVKWDAFVYVADPDALSLDLTERSARFRAPLGDTDDGLRGFEIADPDGYVLFFGRPA